MEEKKLKKPHSLMIDSDNSIKITGIVDVGSFDDESINLYTDFGLLQIKGEKIQVGNIDIESGIFDATGKVVSFEYSEKRQKKQSFISKVFR